MDLNAMREQLGKIQPPPIPRDFAKLITGDTGRLNPPQVVAYLEHFVAFLNRTPKIPVQATIERDGWDITIRATVTVRELPPAPTTAAVAEETTPHQATP